MNKAKILFLAMRPWSFVVSIVAVVIPACGLSFIDYSVNWWMVLWAVLGMILFHAVGNTVSDYFDFKKGVDSEDTYGQEMVAKGIVSAKYMGTLACVMTVLAITNGIGLWWATGWDWRLLVIGGIGAIITLCYAFFKFHAMGDIAITTNFGFLPALGTSLVATGNLTWDALWFVLLFIPITNAVLHANNTRDTHTDSRAEIKTIPMIIGKKASQYIYYFEVLLPCVWTIVLVCLGKLPWLTLIVLASLKLVLFNCKMMHAFTTDEHAIDHLDERTAQLQMINSLLILVGLGLNWVISLL